MQEAFNNKRKEEKKVINVGNLLDNAVFVKKVTAFVVIVTLVLGIFFAGKENVYLIQIAKSTTSSIIDDTTTTKDNLLTSASNYLLASVSSFKNTTASDAKYIKTSLNKTTNKISDNIFSSASLVKQYLTSNAQTLTNNTNQILTRASDQLLASASVLTSITSTTKELVNNTAQYVTDTVDSVFAFFNQPEEQPILVVEEQQDLSAEALAKEEEPIIVEKTEQTVINQPVIERVVQTKEILTVGGITTKDLNTAIEQLRNKIYSDMSSLTSANEQRIVNNYTTISQTNKIDKLSNVTLTNVSGLTDSDIPDSITASNYLPLSGGTLTSGLTGTSLTLSDTLEVNGISTFSSFSATSTATSTIAGQLGLTFAPVVSHSFGTWTIGASGANPTSASLYINPASAAADSNLLGLAVADSVKFLVDAEGDLFANSITAVGGVTLSTTTASTFTVENDITIGDATTTDSIYLNAMIASSLIPKYDNMLDIGSSSPQRMWRTGYFGTSIGVGTTSPYTALSIEGSSALGNSALAGYFTATSTTATSTFMGVLSIGSTTPSASSLFSVGTSSPLLYIDKDTGNVGVGSSGGSDRQLEVLATGDAQLRLSQDSSTYTDFVVAPTTGDLTLNLYPNSSANDVILAMPGGSTGANLWICEGSACPNTTFSGGGNLFVEGDIKYATSSRKTYRSIILTAAGAVAPTSGGAAKTQVDGTNHSYYVLDFDASSDEAAYWQWTMPDSYDGGTIDVTYYWEAGSTSSDVVWCFQTAGIQANNSEDIDPSLSSGVCETDTAQGNANDLALIEETDATSGFAAGDYVSFKVFRDADNGSDTMSGDARLVKVKIEYGVSQESD